MKSLDKGNRMEKVLGEGRMRLFDKMVGSRGGGMGKKTNPRCRFFEHFTDIVMYMYVSILMGYVSSSQCNRAFDMKI